MFFFKQKTAYEMRISDWSSDVCSSDLLGHRTRQPRLDAADAVLHLDLRLADRRSRLEGDGDGDAPRGVRGRLEVDQPGDAVQLLLDRTGDALVHLLRRGPRIIGGRRDLRRRDVGILRERQEGK